jgi:hypothetical protein
MLKWRTFSIDGGVVRLRLSSINLIMTNPKLQTKRLRPAAAVAPALIAILAALAWCLIQAPAHGQDLNEKYLQIHDIVQQAENYKTIGQPDKALAKFKEAQTALLAFQHQHPDWKPRMVTFRLSYLADKINPPAPKGSTSATSNNTAASAVGAPPKPNAKGGGPTQVKLISAGADPKQVLRLHPKAGDKQSLTMTMKLGMNMQMGEGQSIPMKMPPMKIAMDATVGAVSPSGDITYATVVTDASVVDDPDAMPQAAQAMKTSAAGMKGLTGSGVLTARGVVRDVAMKVPEGSDPQMRQAMDQVKESFSKAGIPLPEEPVGIGAKWEVKMPIKSQGLAISQTAEYELVSLEGDHLTAKSDLTQTAAKQKFSNPAMPNVKIDLTKMDGKGTGETVLDLGKILPTESVMDFHSDMSMSVNMGGKPQPMDTKVDVNVRMESK